MKTKAELKKEALNSAWSDARAWLLALLLAWVFGFKASLIVIIVLVSIGLFFAHTSKYFND